MSLLYIGVRVEISNRSSKIKGIKESYFKNYNTENIFDYHENGKITVERTQEMLIVRGKTEDKFTTGLINFSVMNPLSDDPKEISRLVKIVNVLGNDRLIKERVKTFVEGKSMINNLAEFKGLVKVFMNINEISPGFIESAWYYAPEAKLK